ncbi:response regulator transcription factor [Streptomyces phaeochromogenes]|uniref:AlnR5 two component response regulator n=2 Tax=Streptomyces TaxID=1883 RepID=B6SEH2_9ACTN|nr:response regulator transcription factor [Streptomyces phaeochromogenes]ACI88882.1 AlnR5 two component response regulator [Streptomyces sp. CM020]MCX5597216.1 response regulator transcription factor [Streptomyces phaeochromogenes]WRZ32710.1 response regulator transcription factor [Streptomyces phaeochromogenes]WSD18167.1 response regulator transcription factor [Streptomyces phaeochromogenes]WSJ04999.1 response regulator transcription factor [Streptomyces phaeochromogenes]
MIRLIIAEDVPMLRGALVALMELEQDLSVVAEVGNGNDILPTALEHRPDIAVIDIDLPGTDGLTAAAKLRSCLPSCRVLIITSLGNPAALRRALAAQVDGYVLKDALPSELAQAIRKVAAGQRVIDPQLALMAWDGPAQQLTPREVDVLRLAAAGEDVRVIAKELHLSIGTVRNYLTTIVHKLGARNRVDAVRIARDNGVI